MFLLGLFFKDRQLISLEDEIKRANNKISNLELEIEKMKGHIMSLRGSINRRIMKDTPEEETETNKNPTVFLTPNGYPLKS